MITFENFYLSTEAVFKGCKTPKRKPNFISYSKRDNAPSSYYWYGEDIKGKYIIRNSDHWSKCTNFNTNIIYNGCLNIASCFWSLKSTKIKEKIYYHQRERKCKTYLKDENFISGKCYLKHFNNI